jgi:predicted MPP superfamily phosphohydrolase
MKLPSVAFEFIDTVRRFAVILLFAAAGAYFTFGIFSNLKVERNNVSIYIHDAHVAPISLSVAVLGDIHLPEGLEPLDEFRELLLEVKAAAPDLVLLVGDYVSNPRGKNLSGHRENISMRRLRPIDFRVVFSRSVVGTQVYELAGESRTRSL